VRVSCALRNIAEASARMVAKMGRRDIRGFPSVLEMVSPNASFQLLNWKGR
jgi:hypothetical protein